MIRRGMCDRWHNRNAAAGCGGENSTGAGGEVTIQLGEQADQGESGLSTTLTEDDDRTEVAIGTPERRRRAGSVPQPALLHKGCCIRLDVAAGPADQRRMARSTSTVDAALVAAGRRVRDQRAYSRREVERVACGGVGTAASAGDCRAATSLRPWASATRPRRLQYPHIHGRFSPGSVRKQM